jgi:hypothetical protein
MMSFASMVSFLCFFGARLALVDCMMQEWLVRFGHAWKNLRKFSKGTSSQFLNIGDRI